MRLIAASLPFLACACAGPILVPAAAPEPPLQNAFALPAAQPVEQTALAPLPEAQPAAAAAAVAPSQPSAPNPRNFAGRWTAQMGGESCDVVMTSGAPRPDGTRLLSAASCGGALQGAQGWRLGQNSIDIVGPSGVLATLGEGAPGTLSGSGVVLTR